MIFTSFSSGSTSLQCFLHIYGTLGHVSFSCVTSYKLCWFLFQKHIFPFKHCNVLFYYSPIKLELKNALNTVRLDHLPTVCSERAPPIARLAHLAYSPSYRQTGPSCLQLLLSPDWPILPTAPPIARQAHLAYSSSYRQTGPSCLQPLLSPDWPILPTAPPIARLAHLAYSSSNRQTGPSCQQLLQSPDWPILSTAPPPPFTRSALLLASNKVFPLVLFTLRWQMIRWHHHSHPK